MGAGRSAPQNIGRHVMPIAIRQLQKHFFGEVSGLDLRQPLTADEAREIEAAMDKYAVLVFHGQDITARRPAAAPSPGRKTTG
jgi:alpha-ketoglutarate-dependent taurine dioxygenase